jgi:ferric-dicitrate binding protein FerR (iron transport regulator)/TolA-binding protein
MEGEVSALERLGHHVREAQERVLAPMIARPPPLERLLATGAREPAPSSQPLRRMGGLVLAAAAVLLAIVVLAGRRPGALAFVVGGDERHGRVGEWVAASAASLPIAFSDGTRLALAAGSRARVEAVDADGARVVLERGELEASVRHRAATRWSVDAGPYVVQVTGTQFSVSWDPESERFDLTLQEGSVVAFGPMLAEGRRIAKGEHLSAFVGARRVAIVGEAEQDAGVAQAREAGGAAVPPAAEREGEHEEPSMRASAAVPEPRAAAPHVSVAWRTLAREGAYREALREAEQAGFGAIVEGADAEDLVLLADAARLGGAGGRAAQALQALRRRYPHDLRAASAAFHLGRLAFDGRAAHAEAARWFATYLAEQPSGPFAREAAGRLVEARERAGDISGARDAARAYLARYPTGPHAGKARSLLPGSSELGETDAGDHGQAPR